MNTFNIVSTSAFIPLYNKFIIPLFRKVTERELKPLSELKKIGIGLGILRVAMVLVGLVEQWKLSFWSDSREEKSSLNVFWQTPRYISCGGLGSIHICGLDGVLLIPVPRRAEEHWDRVVPVILSHKKLPLQHYLVSRDEVNLKEREG
ncbi:hypothetical protein CDL15_Pgr016348 [Punica granatum]|uniref:Uncharacterized protein n=1 Tax=Punica granatum TaxID=22663 RepID=A0A218W6M3_PUNGR|nr:hypothetical protein CDL15_Pgr016348 [Punica granatum]PKI67415.1 hypothetical protein CRG98_012200 [Punica granatum]